MKCFVPLFLFFVLSLQQISQSKTDSLFNILDQVID
jgi:hypothetical protein